MSRPRSHGAPDVALPLFDIVHTARLADRVFTETFAAEGLAAGQFGVLASVNDEPGITQAEVARRLHVRPQTIARPVGRLLEEGLIRTEQTLRQGQASGLHISLAGKALLDRAWPAVVAVNDPSRMGLDGDEAAELGRLLSRVREALQER